MGRRGQQQRLRRERRGKEARGVAERHAIKAAQGAYGLGLAEGHVLQRMLHDQTGEGGGRSLISNIQLVCGGGGGGFRNSNSNSNSNNNSSMASENAQQEQALPESLAAKGARLGLT